MTKNKDAEIKLAEAMNNLADKLSKFQDPIIWQKILNDAMRVGWIPPVNEPPTLRQPIGTPLDEVPVSVSYLVTRSELHLSNEDRDKLVMDIYDKVKPQMEDLHDFVKQSLHEMPAGRLKQLKEKIDQGENAKLSRRYGCIYLELDSEEIYLGL